MHKGWQGNGMSGEHTHRSGPRVYHAGDGDYTQKIEDKDGRITHLSHQWEREGKQTCKKTVETTSGAENREKNERWLQFLPLAIDLHVQIPFVTPPVILLKKDISIIQNLLSVI